MKRGTWAGLLALAGGLGALTGCGKDYPPTPEGYYMAKCSRCHEVDGSSATASKQADKEIDLRQPLFQRNVSDREIIEIVLEGKGRMMPVAGLDSAAVDSVVLHVRRLGTRYVSVLDSLAGAE